MSTEPAARSPAVKPKLAARPTVIYCFTWAAGSGGVYVGKRTPPASCNVAEWPTTGTGRLPCGYGGSGKVITNARRAHGDGAFSWQILEVVPEGGDYAGAEARWVAWAKGNHPEVCRNLTNGGDGYDSAASRGLWQRFEYRQRISRAMSQQWQDLAFRQRISESAGQRVLRQWQDPAFRERISRTMSETNRTTWADPSTRATMHRAALQKRLSAAVKRRDRGEQPRPLDNLCLEAFAEPRNPLPCALPREPRSEELLSVLEALRANPEGLNATALCRLLGRPERGSGGARAAMDNLRNKCHQPILLDPEGRFVLLPEGSY